MAKMTKFPSIEQFRNVVQGLKLHYSFEGLNENGEPIYNTEKKLPVISFEGTVKLHGTNAGIVSLGDEIWFQSRTNVITPVKDNAGFATFFSSTERIEKLKAMLSEARTKFNVPDDHPLGLFGEWIGKGIQKGVAINGLDKRLVLFGIKEVLPADTNEENGNVDDSKWHPIDGFRDHSMEVYNIKDYPTYSLELDLNDPQKAADVFTALVDEVENECPFGKAFGVSGLGEGIVWIAHKDGRTYRFKTKGEKHSVVKVKKERSPLDIEKVNNIKEFIDYAVTENRLEQGIEQVFTSNGEVPTVKGTGPFIKWVSNDVAKEEIDTLVENGLTMKDVGGELSKKSKEWFFSYLDKKVLG